MKKIIIDADPGVDDAFAITLALKSGLFDILGISVVDGNCSLNDGIKNTFKILDINGYNDLKVFKGMKKSLVRKKINAKNVHGNNGLGDLKYKKINRKVEKESAIDFLISSVNKFPNEITIIAVGPLTNIAKAILEDSSFANKVKELIIMGGANEKGNITPYAEFNFYKDPHAAKIVLESNIKSIKIFSLDVTNKLPLTKKYEKELYNCENELAQFLYNITRIGAEYDRNAFNFDGLIINDPLTVAYLIDESLVELKDTNIEIVLESERIGQSIIKFVEKSNIKFSTQVDTKKFYNILFKEIFK